jgi:hypothetical protein
MATETGDQRPKKAYDEPRITHHGSLKDLTAGGTGNADENSMGQSKRP